MHDYISNGTGRCDACNGERVIGEHTGTVHRLKLNRYAVFQEGNSNPHYIRVASKEIARKFFEAQGLHVMWVFQTEAQ